VAHGLLASRMETGREAIVENYMMFAVGLMIALIAAAGALAMLRDVH